MLKMYLQVFLTLGSFFGVVLSTLWFSATYIYYKQLLADGYTPVFNWTFVAFVGAFLAVCLVTFVYCVKWVIVTRKEAKAKMAHYRKMTRTSS